MKQRLTHDYTNEVELKSLVIREKNARLGQKDESKNAIINELTSQYKETKDPELKRRIIKMSEETAIDKVSHEKFGEIILLMIKKILTKPNFSGYSWVDEFYSTACYRVFKYIHNFDHTKKSERTGLEVNAFSYITQIITMSILEVINKNNKNSKDLEDYTGKVSSSYDIFKESKNKSSFEPEIKTFIHEHIIDYDFKKLAPVVRELIREHNSGELKIYYPKNYKIGYDEYAELQGELKKSLYPISLIRIEINE